MNYLFIGDNKVQLMILKKYFAQFFSAHEIRILNKPMEVIGFIASLIFLPDVIIVDFNMSEMNGLGFINKMKLSDYCYGSSIMVSTTIKYMKMAMKSVRKGI